MVIVQKFFTRLFNGINKAESPVTGGTSGDAAIEAVTKNNVGRFGGFLLPDYTPPKQHILNPSEGNNSTRIAIDGIGCFGAYTGVRNPLEKALRYPGDTAARAIAGDPIERRIGHMGRLLSPGSV